MSVALSRSRAVEPDPEAPETPPIDRRARLLGRLGAVAFVAVGTLLITAHARLYGSWIMDDAAITFGYARNVAAGLGPVLQPGAEPVEGYSNPTWLALLALGARLGLFDSGTIFGVPD